MKTFLNSNKPIITTMLKAADVDNIIAEITRSLSEGAQAFGFQIETLPPEQRTETNYKKIFSAMDGRPAYVTAYQRSNVSPVPQSDEELGAELLKALDCGAVLLDIRGDMFCQCDGELTFDPAAVEKQKRFIQKIHDKGGEVLMSSHVMKFISRGEVLKIAEAQAERGADIAKIVTNADSEEELSENFEALLLLKKELKIPALFLCNGTHCKSHRVIGPVLGGSPLFLTTENSFAAGTVTQPANKTAAEILKIAF